MSISINVLLVLAIHLVGINRTVWNRNISASPISSPEIFRLAPLWLNCVHIDLPVKDIRVSTCLIMVIPSCTTSLGWGQITTNSETYETWIPQNGFRKITLQLKKDGSATDTRFSIIDGVDLQHLQKLQMNTLNILCNSPTISGGFMKLYLQHVEGIQNSGIPEYHWVFTPSYVQFIIILGGMLISHLG